MWSTSAPSAWRQADMLIRELGIENFRKFRQPVRLTGFGDGLNLVCEPNETGKSTILEALRAALFERHGAKSQRIRSFRPHGDEVAPSVDLVFEVDGQTWSLKKKFLQGASVLLEGRAERYQSDEAEEKLQSLLGFTRAGNAGADDDSRSALGLLWVEQGQFVLGAPGQSARRTFEDVLAGEVGAVTGGRRTVAVVQAIDKSVADLLTATGRPTRLLAEALEAAAEAQAAAAAAQTELDQFEETLTRLDSKRGELRRVRLDLEDDEEKAAVVQILADIERAKTAAQILQNAASALREAQGARERLEERFGRRAADAEALSAATGIHSQLAATLTSHSQEIMGARAAVARAEQEVADARSQVATAEEARTAAFSAHLQAERGRALLAAFGRLEAAEGLAEALERLRNEVADDRLTEAAATSLTELERKVLEARTVVEASAAVVEIFLAPDASGVRLDGTEIVGDHSLVLSAAHEIEAPSLGRVVLTPPASGEAAVARLRAAESDLGDLLVRVGHPDAASARAAARRRSERVADADALAARLVATCPADQVLGLAAGIEALRSALADEARPAADAVDPERLQADRADAEAAFQAARTGEEEARGRLQAALDALQRAELEEVRLNGAVQGASAEVERLRQQLADARAEASDEDLVATLEASKAAEGRAGVDHEIARRSGEGLDLVVLERKRDTAERRRSRLNDERLELVGAVARIEEQAKTLGGLGPAARAQVTLELAQVAQRHADRLKEEAEVLTLLKRTLEAAQAEASRKYLAPITRRVEPYVRRLLPTASLSFDEDFRPNMLTRSGREESASDLSKGTQEQIAVLTRLAFADLLVAKGKPASLVLDDALVFADDDRFETMTEILAEAATRMQVIVLSCRVRAFRHVEATRLSLEF